MKFPSFLFFVTMLNKKRKMKEGKNTRDYPLMKTIPTKSLLRRSSMPVGGES
jgi:hypothetical protein